mgnify:CR=1 FL=1
MGPGLLGLVFKVVFEELEGNLLKHSSSLHSKSESSAEVTSSVVRIEDSNELVKGTDEGLNSINNLNKLVVRLSLRKEP